MSTTIRFNYCVEICDNSYSKGITRQFQKCIRSYIILEPFKSYAKILA